MKKVLFLTLPLLLICNSLGAQDFDDEKFLAELGIDAGENKVEYSFREIPPELNLHAGYRFFDLDGSAKAFEYEYPKDFPVLGGELRTFKYPHRLHLDFNVDNTRSYHGDVHYAYKDHLITRWYHNNFFHNLENIELVDLDASSGNYRTDVRDGDDDYGVTTGIDNFMLRLKAPGYPAHLFLRGLYVDREGSQQQRSLLGSGWFQNIERTSRNRDTDWHTLNYEIGANGHLGIAEFELSRREKRFDIEKGEVLYDTYEASAFRPAGVFPHNGFSEFRGSSNTIRFHTIYTEQLVASATFSLKERDNISYGASADEFHGAGSLQWTPLTRLSVFLNYSHSDQNIDNPDTTSITDRSGSVTIYSRKVKPSISRTTDMISLTGRYKPESRVTLKAGYLFENIGRENAGDWNLPDSTRRNTLTLSADMRPFKRVNISAGYEQGTTDNPAYNTDPDYFSGGSASLSWMPSAGINLLLHYGIMKAERDDLSFTETADARDRTARTDNLMGSGTFQILPNLSFTASYAYLVYKVKQDIVYDSLGNVPFVDYNVPMKNTAHVYAGSFNYVPVDKLFLTAGVTHTQGEEEFTPGSRDLVEPVSVALFSERKVKETAYRLSGEYEFRNGFSGGAELKYNDFRDALDNIYDSDSDGDSYIILLSLRKRWG